MSRRRRIVSSMISTFSQPMLSANLPSPEERERQKHRVLENLHGAIKEVQLQECSVNEDLPATLTIHDNSCQLLCRHLDHALLHGLRHLANGYWLFVKEFTHKDTIDVIHKLKNVNSNLGKGRAWLYISLNESSLESYFRTIHVNPSIVDKYYITEAFVRDEQRMEMLITMVSGLEYASFQLEIDSPFLNHSIIPMQNDDLSLVKKETNSFGSCSMNSSFLSQKSAASLDSPAISQDEDSGFVNMESSQITLLDLNVQQNHSNLVPDILDQKPNQSDFYNEQMTEFTDENLEVVHVTTKKSKRKKKSSSTTSTKVTEESSNTYNSFNKDLAFIQTKQDNLVLPCDSTSIKKDSECLKELSLDKQSFECEHSSYSNYVPNSMDVPLDFTNETKSLTAQENENDINNKENDLKIMKITAAENSEESISIQLSEPISVVDSTNKDVSNDEKPSELHNNYNPFTAPDPPLNNEVKEKNNCRSSGIMIHRSSSISEVKPAIKLRDKSNSSERKNPAKRVSFEIDLIGNDTANKTLLFGEDEYYTINSSVASPSQKDIEKSPPKENYELEMFRGSPEGQEMPDAFRSTLSNSIEESIYDTKTKKSKPMSFLTDFPKVNKTEVSERSRQYAQEIDTELKKAMTEKQENADIKVDNNTLLRLMLDVLKEGERFYKMYHASVGHTENKLSLLFPILTDKRLYLLQYHFHQCEFIVKMVIPYSEIDYILLGINYQTVQIICKWRRKHFALCTGDECLTRSIVSSLEVAIRRWCNGSNLPCVFTDAMMQTIGLQKFIANEINIERHEVSITYYALIHWEDPQLPPPHSPAGPSKEGHLMYCHCHSGILSNKHRWIPSYFVLRAGVLYQFKNKGSTELEYYICLHGPEFRGCKRSTYWKRPHVFELQLKNESALHLAAANDYEVSEWLQAFLQTVSHKIIYEDDLEAYKSCCLAIASERIFICQEDLEMFTFTSLASANLGDVVAVRVDNDKKLPYCILEFESVDANICTGDWILYFNSESEIKKFLKVLEDAWKEIFKVSLSVYDIEDEVVKKKCEERINAIHSSWKIGYDMLKEPSAIMKICPSPQ